MRQKIQFLTIIIMVVLLVTTVTCDRSKSSKDSSNKGRRIIRKLPDPSGQFIAILDEIDYANGLLTSTADRICIVDPKKNTQEGDIVFSEDALPDSEKPTIVWKSNTLLITISKNSNIISRKTQVNGILVELRNR